MSTVNPTPVIWQDSRMLVGAQAPGRPPSPRGPYVVTWLRMPHLGVSMALKMEPVA
jgi:hypothetical protein